MTTTLPMRNLLPCLCLAFLVGCTHLAFDETLRLPSDAIVEDIAETSEFDEFQAMSQRFMPGVFMEPDDLLRHETFLAFWLGLGLSSEELENEVRDVFWREKTLRVDVFTRSSAREIADMVEHWFHHSGWRFRRGIMMLEETGGGGDWLKVFSKGDMQVLVHVVGEWDPVDVEDGCYSVRLIRFRFHHCPPELVVGMDLPGMIGNGGGQREK